MKKFPFSAKLPVEMKGDGGIGFSGGLISFSTSSEKLCHRLKALGDDYIDQSNDAEETYGLFSFSGLLSWGYATCFTDDL